VARVIAVFDDLLRGSNVLGSLTAGGHDAHLGGAHVEEVDADVLVVDLGAAGFDGIDLVERLRADDGLGGARTLGVYSHVQHDVAERARDAGFDLVVPRSRMAREGAALVDRLAGG
jgi:DNA-binding NarL/FixJ family response regulator